MNRWGEKFEAAQYQWLLLDFSMDSSHLRDAILLAG